MGGGKRSAFPIVSPSPFVCFLPSFSLAYRHLCENICVQMPARDNECTDYVNFHRSDVISCDNKNTIAYLIQLAFAPAQTIICLLSPTSKGRGGGGEVRHRQSHGKDCREKSKHRDQLLEFCCTDSASAGVPASSPHCVQVRAEIVYRV